MLSSQTKRRTKSIDARRHCFKMCGIHASAMGAFNGHGARAVDVVAGVVDLEAARDRAYQENVRRAMRKFLTLRGHRESGVALSVDRSRPQPATVLVFRDLLQEPLKDWALRATTVNVRATRLFCAKYLAIASWTATPP